MVDVGHKPESERVAIAKGEIHMQKETLDLISAGGFKKGDVIGVARVAGIMAAKRTSELIPLCHPLPLHQVTVDFELDRESACITITVQARTNAITGVEMEALTGVAISALTIYDMAKSADKKIKIQNIRLVEKRGGQSGDVINE